MVSWLNACVWARGVWLKTRRDLLNLWNVNKTKDKDSNNSDGSDDDTTEDLWYSKVKNSYKAENSTVEAEKPEVLSVVKSSPQRVPFGTYVFPTSPTSNLAPRSSEIPSAFLSSFMVDWRRTQYLHSVSVFDILKHGLFSDIGHYQVCIPLIKKL
jgi:hypothetical protein